MSTTKFDWNINKDILASASTEGFLQEAFSSKTPDYCINRLQMIGFNNRNYVLDAGCGAGQWTVAMGLLNKQAIGVDILEKRLILANALAKGMKVNNVIFKKATIEYLPFPDETFDACFCYNTVTWVNNIEKSIRELYRVLKQGQPLYLSAIRIGWYADQIFNKGNTKGLKSVLGMILKEAFTKSGFIRFSEKKLRALLIHTGFRIISSAPEGKLCIGTSKPTAQPTCPGNFFGVPKMFEVLAEKV